MQKLGENSEKSQKQHLAELREQTELLRKKLLEMAKKHNLKSNLN